HVGMSSNQWSNMLPLVRGAPSDSSSARCTRLQVSRRVLAFVSTSPIADHVVLVLVELGLRGAVGPGVVLRGVAERPAGVVEVGLGGLQVGADRADVRLERRVGAGLSDAQRRV